MFAISKKLSIFLTLALAAVIVNAAAVAPEVR